MAGRRFVIVGDGAAGLAAARHLRRADLTAAITIVSDDPHPAYYRAALTNYLLGELRDDQLWAVPPGFFRDHQVHRRHARATALDAKEQTLRLHDGTALPYDALLVASGARARQPAFEGGDLAGVSTLRTLQDAQRILHAILMEGATTAVVIGGGPLAIELATALAERKVHTTLMVRGELVVADALDRVASDLVIARLRQLGIDVRTSDEVVQLIARDGAIAGVRTRSGGEIACELLGAAIGVVPNSEWLAHSGVETDRGAVVVDEQLRTSVTRIWAAGDVAKPVGPVLRLWEPAQRQGRAAAMSMTGSDGRYTPTTHYFATRLGDLDFASVGTTSEDDTDDVIVDRDAEATGAIAYRKLVLRGGKLVGALMVGHRSERVRARGRAYQKLIERGLDVRPIRDRLFDPHFDVNGWLKQAELLVPRAVVRSDDVAQPAAAVRGTQTIRVATEQPNIDVFAPTTQTPLLSIGFRSPEAKASQLETSAGFLESSRQRYPLELRTVIIGRGRLCDIVLEDPTASHRHASVTRHRGALYLRDLGSRHGTWVNRGMVTTPHPLKNGDTVKIGATELVFKSAEPQSLSDASDRLSAAASSRHAYLQGVSGPAMGLSFQLQPDVQTTLGRDVASVVRLDDISVSRRHALVSGAGGKWTICDLHSSRGTSKNGQALEPGRDEPLESGDELHLGDTVLRFVTR